MGCAHSYFFYHDHLDPLGDGVGLVVLLLHHLVEVAQLPDGMALLVLSRQLVYNHNNAHQRTHSQHRTHGDRSMDDPRTEWKPYLQHQGHARREEGHEHKVVGQDRHAPEAAHDLQLANPCQK